MLSHQRSNLQVRYRQHRRQISTPTTLEAGKVPSLPAPALQRFQAHRRGQSLDQRSLHARRPQSVQNGASATVPFHTPPPPITNETAYQKARNLMIQEAQCQQPIQHGHLSVPPPCSTPMSMVAEPQAFTQEDLQALTCQNDDGNDPSIHAIGGSLSTSNDASEIQPLKLALNRIQQQRSSESNPSYANFADIKSLDSGSWDLYQQEDLNPVALQQQQHQQANGIVPDELRRLSAQSDISPQMHQSCTPIIQTNDSKDNSDCAKRRVGSVVDDIPEYHPITPATTPFRLSVDLSQCNEHIHNQSAKSQYLSVPSPTQQLHSTTATSTTMQQAKPLEGGGSGTTFAERAVEIPSPPDTASLDIGAFDVFDYQQAASIEDPESFHSLQSQNSTSSSSVASSFYAPSEPSDILSFEEPKQKAQKVAIQPITPRRGSPKKTPSTTTPNLSPAKPRLSPRVASINHLNLDSRVHASINNTGITIDEIASFIHGPDPEDGKWMCLHTGCGRRFGRKENIKSHVQTHLGDRQYKCDHCSKCFVRGHDLKRHAKIHTGDKPYECLCGNVFARHDALTRHRQRGMCIGAYKGVVRKMTKRGRPRKQRPEADERNEKAAKSRRRAQAHEKSSSSSSSSSTSSISGSEASHNSPPSDVFRNMHIHCGSSPVEGSSAPVFHMPNYSLPPPAFNFTPPSSPGYHTGSDFYSERSYRSLTPNSEDEMVPQQRPSTKTAAIEESGLPELDDRVCPNGDITITNPDPDPLLSPHDAPTVTDASTLPDLDVFINPGPTTFTKDGLQFIDDPDMIEFPDYSATTTFGDGMDLFPGKGFSAAGTTGLSDDDFFSFQFHSDEQPSDVLTKDLLMD